jgi:hypothetical protein
MNYRRTTSVFIAALTLFTLDGAIHVRAAEVTLDDVLRVWKKREEATRTFRFETTDDHLEVKGMPRPVRTSGLRILTVDGVKMKHEIIGDAWNGIDAAIPMHQITSLNGEHERDLRKLERNDDLLHSTGWIRKGDRHGDVGNIFISPILRHYRPIGSTFQDIKLDKLRVAGTDTLDGVPCVILEETGQPGRIAKYFVAPEREMAILRYERTFHGRKTSQAEIAYQHDPKHGWVPERWSAALFEKGDTLMSSGSHTVTHFEINATYSKEMFDVVFPPGTEVFDRVANKNFVIKADASWREVLPTEQKAKYTELMNSNTGDAVDRGKEEGSGISRIVLVIALVVLVVGVVALAVRKGRLSWGFPLTQGS